MEQTVKTYFDLTNPGDVELVQQLLDDSDWDDGSDSEDTLPIRSGSDKPPKRVGAEVLHVGEEIEELQEEDVDDPEQQQNAGLALEEVLGAAGAEDALEEALQLYFSTFETEKKRNKKKLTVKWKNGPIVSSAREEPRNEDVLDHVIEEVLSPIKYFSKYVTDELLETAVFCTNLYATQTGTARFTPTEKSELTKFIALHIIMGSIKFPRVHLYWDSTLKLKVFPNTMSRERLFQLRTHLHFVNTLERPDNCRDRFFKVRPLYNAIRKVCLERDVEGKLSIDEQMVPFTGKLNVKQYVKGKPCPWGIKIFFLCGTSGLPYDFLLYQGETTELQASVKKLLGLGGGVAYTLAQRISNDHNHELYFDNFFSNFHLLKLLKDRGIKAGGTIRVNRFYQPPFSIEKDFNRNPRGFSEEFSTSDNKVTCLKWLDNKSVIMASNFVGKGTPDAAKRWDKKEKAYVQIERPELIRLYNKAMGGVDLLDQLISLYRIDIRSRKWTVKMTQHGIDLATVCSWLEYRKDARAIGTPSKDILDLLAFRMKLADQLINYQQDPSKDRKKRGRPSTREAVPQKRVHNQMELLPDTDVRYDGIGHLPIHDHSKNPSRCKSENCSERSHTFYVKCHVHLCHNSKRNCFYSFHVE